MENFMNMELRLRNSRCENHVLSILPDICGDNDLIAFSFIFNETEINLKSNNRDADREEEGNEYFHLDKFQVKCFINYLKNLYDVMD